MKFTKVEGLGNDFVLIDARSEGVAMDEKRALALCDRHFGIGADGVLILRPSTRADALLDIWNSDGSRSEMCGNGLRCAAQLVAQGKAGDLRIETEVGVHGCRAVGPNRVFVELLGLKVGAKETVNVDGRVIEGRVMSMGNPHFIVRGLSLDETPVLGPKLEMHSRFAPAKTNVELCEVRGRTLKVRVWERGAGLTLACGTGAGASAAAAWADGLLPTGPTEVELPGGVVTVEPIGTDKIGLTGPARQVFAGAVDA